MGFVGVLLGLAVIQCWINVHEEWLGRKARKLKGLPKPWWEATDDEAYKWFLRYPDHRIRMTLDFFPHSVVLQKQDTT